MADLLDQVHAQTQKPAGDLLDQVHAQGGEKPGFGQRLYETTVGPIVDTVKDPIGAVKGLFNIPKLQEIGKHIQEGNYGHAALALGQYATENPAVRGGHGIVDPIASDVKEGNLAGAAGGVAGNVLSFAVPELAGRVLPKVPGVTAAADATKTALNKGALRAGFQTTTDASKVSGAAEAMTEHSIPFSEAGQRTVDQLLADLQKQKDAATGSSRSRVDPGAVELRLDETATRKKWQSNPQPDQKQVEAVRHNFRETTGGQPMLDAQGKQLKDRFGNKMFSQGTAMPADEAQALKEGTYANNDYESTPAHRRATADTEMALARGLKEELETQIPELAGLNESQAKLLNLKGILETAVNKYTNDGGFWGGLAKNTISSPRGALKTASVLGGGAAVHEPVLAGAVTLMQAILSDPAVKARLATAIDVVQKSKPGRFGKIAATATGASRVQSYMDSLSPKEQQ